MVSHILLDEPTAVVAVDDRIWQVEILDQGLEFASILFVHHAPKMVVIFSVARSAYWLPAIVSRGRREPRVDGRSDRLVIPLGQKGAGVDSRALSARSQRRTA